MMTVKYPKIGKVLPPFNPNAAPQAQVSLAESQIASKFKSNFVTQNSKLKSGMAETKQSVIRSQITRKQDSPGKNQLKSQINQSKINSSKVSKPVNNKKPDQPKFKIMSSKEYKAFEKMVYAKKICLSNLRPMKWLYSLRQVQKRWIFVMNL